MRAESGAPSGKDRLLMEYDPYQMIEGILIAGMAMDSHKGYLYIRGEYRYLIDHMDAVIAEGYARGYLGKNIAGTGFDFDLIPHSGAGAYECGEENGAAGFAGRQAGDSGRMKPPFPAVAGAWASPTLLNNVETFSAIPVNIIRDGGRGVRGTGHAEERRHSVAVHLRAREQAGRV